jgi:hypothetical protein
MNGICRVCELIDNDTTLKEVEYCELCKANICNECKPNLLKRGKAAIKEQMKKLIALTVITFTLACNEDKPFTELKEYPKQDKYMDSLNRRADSLMLDYSNFKQAQADSIAKLYR